MSDWSVESLLEPLSTDLPCGEDLEDTALLASFDTYRLFGQGAALDAPAEPGEMRQPKPLDSPEWADVRDRALEALGKSKDLRLLAHLAAAVLRTDGVIGFTGTLVVAAEWLQTYWQAVYPPIDGDGLLRRNALNCFADQWAVLDALRRLPLVASRRLGRVSLRDIDVASGQVQPAAGAAAIDEGTIAAVFADVDIAVLEQMHGAVKAALDAINRITASMSEGIGTEAMPTFDPLAGQLVRIERLFREKLRARQPAAAGEDAAADAADGAPGSAPAPAVRVGAIGSREDAIRALDAVAEYFRRAEPSSPVPLLVERAKRLVAKDFLEVLMDLAPDALDHARAAAGIRPE